MAKVQEGTVQAPPELLELARTLARAAAHASQRLGIHFDMEDPKVARDVMTATFQAVIYSAPKKSTRQTSAGHD